MPNATASTPTRRRPRSALRRELGLWRRWVTHPIREAKALVHLRRFNQSARRLREHDRAVGHT